MMTVTLLVPIFLLQNKHLFYEGSWFFFLLVGTFFFIDKKNIYEGM